MLYYQEFGDTGPPVLMLHGLFGSATNWRGIARELADDYHVFAADLRNHGRSPHEPTMSYADMADDIASLIDQLGAGDMALCGHSMGGKAAMLTALLHPEKVSRLIVLDIAPVVYGHSFLSFVDAMLAIDTGTLASRADADRSLAAVVNDAATRQFLMQNLVSQDGSYRWRLNLDVLRMYMSELGGFPEDLVAGRTWEGETIFIFGDRSDYVLPEHHDRIMSLFPAAQISELPGAGHWLHADQPAQLLGRIRAFMAQNR